MKAYGYTEHGGPEVLQEFEMDTPKIYEHELLLKSIKVGLNNYERSMRESNNPIKSEPVIPGHDVLGKIEAVGGVDDRFEVGDLVIAHVSHAYAQETVAKIAKVAKIPETIDLNAAAGMITPGITAYNAVNAFADIKPGQTVIVDGASGGVGSIAVQLLVQKGVRVIGIASSKNASFVQSLGVNVFEPYDQVDVGKKLANIADVVINTAMSGSGGETDIQMLKDSGQLVTVGMDEPDTKGKKITFAHIQPTNKFADGMILQELVDMMVDGKLIVRVDQTLPFNLAGFVKGNELLAEHPQGRLIVGE